MADIGVLFSSAGTGGPTAYGAVIGRLEDAGFDHVFMSEAYNDALTALAIIAPRTRTATIGSAIANIYRRHPYLMAMSAAAVADVARGRLVLGLGTGHRTTNEQRLGLDMSRPVARMREYVTMVRLALDSGGRPFDFDGEFYRAHGAVLRWPPAERVPIVLAALGPRMVELAGETADAIVTSTATAAQITGYRRILDETADRVGRPRGRIYCVIATCLAARRDEARDRLRVRVENALEHPTFYRGQVARGRSRDGRLGDDEIDALGIAGPPAYARERLAEYRESGVDVPLLAPFTADPADRAGGFRAFSAGSFLELTSVVG
jgi:alkanesulfonate monooxygenase SsuD/methylene tetrahydromethanopterin reductase-like flavin-dependent oxidoreductase (luciferase family)